MFGFLKNSDSGLQTEPVDVRGPSASTFPRLMPKKWEHSGGNKILLVKEKEPDGEAKTLHVQSPQIPPRSPLPVTGRPFRPEVPFCSAITPLADRSAWANINVISQRGRRPRPEPDDISHMSCHHVSVTEPTVHAKEEPRLPGLTSSTW